MPRDISRFWLRRLVEVSLFAHLSVLVLYAWARFIPTGYRLPLGESVSDRAALLFAITSVILAILTFWLPKKHTSIIALSIYIIDLAAFSALVWTSGKLFSPFLNGWLVLGFFSGYFGLVAIGAALAFVISAVVAQHLGSIVDISQILAQLLFGVVPIVMGLIVWWRKPEKKENPYADLAHKLSSVEGKSDVVINTIDDGVLAISRSGIIELINPSAAQMMGWQQKDALNLDWKSVLKLVTTDGRDVPEHENPIVQALATGKPAHSDTYMLKTSSGKAVLVSLVGSPVGPNNEGVIVVFRDITKERAEEREQAEFISTASHEMRTPVASIEGYLGLALNPATAQIDEKARDFITKAHESAQHLGRLFQDLLDITKAEDGRLKNEPRIINVNDFIKDIFQGLEQKALEKNLRYIFKPSPGNTNTTEGERTLRPVYYVNVDPDHLREVVANLIENAIKYTPTGEVVVDVTGDNAVVTISVQDSGIGIPKEDIAHLFQKFYRVDNSDTREIGGTGLGLYLSRRLVEAIGGQISVESEYKKGSTFFVTIPRISHDEAMTKIQNNTEQLEQSTTASVSAPQTTVPITTPQQISQVTNVPAYTLPSNPAAQSIGTQPRAEELSAQGLMPTTIQTSQPMVQPTSVALRPPTSPAATPQTTTAPTIAELEQQAGINRPNSVYIPPRKT